MEEVKDIVFLTLTLGWKNEKQPSGPTELDLEADNLVNRLFWFYFWEMSFFRKYALEWKICVQKT